MTNQALPRSSYNLLSQHINDCKNLGLILDKYAPWAQIGRDEWQIVMKETIRRRGQNKIEDVTEGQAKGLWLSTSRRAKRGETPSIFEEERADSDLIEAKKDRWLQTINANDGIAFKMTLSERMAAGLGAAHVLETGLTLDRNTGLPYLPGSTVKGMARAWGLIEVAAQLGIKLYAEKDPAAEGKNILTLNQLSDELSEEKPETLFRRKLSNDARLFINWFQFIFGTKDKTGAIIFMDGIYYGKDAPLYAADVMTPHYPEYYTGAGSAAPADNDNPNPVSFLTVDKDNIFAFGLLPRARAFTGDDSDKTPEDALSIAQDWLIGGLSRLGAGSKTAAGYGFFNRKSAKELPQ